MLAIIDLTSGGTARPLASSNGGEGGSTRSPAAAACAFKALRFLKGTGNLPSSLKYINGLTANISAISMQTMVTNRLSIVKKFGEDSALMTARATKTRAAMTQTMFSSVASL